MFFVAWVTCTIHKWSWWHAINACSDHGWPSETLVHNQNRTYSTYVQLSMFLVAWVTCNISDHDGMQLIVAVIMADLARRQKDWSVAQSLLRSSFPGRRVASDARASCVGWSVGDNSVTSNATTWGFSQCLVVWRYVLAIGSKQGITLYRP